MGARITTLFQTPGNGIIDMSLPGSDALLQQAGAGAKPLGTFTAQRSRFPLGVVVLVSSSGGAVAAGALSQSIGDAAAKSVNTPVAFSATSTRALQRDVDTILGQANRLDPDSILSIKRLGFTIGAPNGDLLPYTGDFDVYRALLHQLYVSFSIGTLPVLRPVQMRGWTDADNPQVAAAIGGTAVTQTTQEWSVGEAETGPLDALIFPDDQITCRVSNPLDITGLAASSYYPIRAYAHGVRYERAGGVG
jgi:hypothetical protein